MNKLAKSVFIGLLTVSFCVNFSFAQSPEAMKVRSAYAQMKIYPGEKAKQLAFLNAFPSAKQQFMEMFQAANNGQLTSNSHEFIESFIDLAKTYPTQVVDKAINIGKDLTWEADATGYMQHGIVQLGNQYTKIFATKVKSLTEADQDKLIKFLADVENHKAYPEYQQLIDALAKTGEVKLSNKMIEAKDLREKTPNH
jgi:hypothetical protein